MTEFIMIVAVSENNVIGKDGKIPWYYKEDMKHFKKLTLGNTVVMGRRTYESIGKPLTGRLNIILTKNHNFENENVLVLDSLEKVIDFCEEFNKVYIIGGQSIYEQTLDIVDKIELTRIHKKIYGTEFFPEINFNKWIEINRDDKGEYSFLTYKRK